MSKTNTTEIGFEQQIWKAAEELRGSMDSSEYKNIVLELIFLKYISDKFEERYQELVDEGKGFEEDHDEYVSEGIFYVPEEARWNKIMEHAHKPDNGIIIDNAMRQIEKEDTDLKDVLPKTFSSKDLNKQKLGAVIDIFNEIKLSDKEDKDILGRTYEYCLSKFAEAEGKKAGEFYTPSCIVKTIVEILEPNEGIIYDPCCGSGGMFVQSQKFIENHSGNISKISVYGQESNPTTWKMAKINLAIRAIEPDLAENPEDTLLNDQHPKLKADYIMANPPFNLKKWGQEKVKDNIRWKYGIPPKSNANFAWIQHMIHHLAPKGKIGLVLANGALSSTTSGEGKIRQKIIEDDLIDCIISLPGQLFYTTGIPVSLWFINKNKKQKGKTLFIDAREMGSMINRKLRELTDEDIQQLAQTYKQYQEGTLQEEKGYSKIATLDDIKEQDYVLTPGRYVGFKPEEDDGIPFDEKMKTLTRELGELFEESNQLEQQIRKTLKEIGHEF